MNNNYSVHMAWSNEDKSFLARVFELPGCMADGKTRQECLENLEVVMKEWLETAQAEGKKIPPPCTVSQLEEMAHKFQDGVNKKVEKEVSKAVNAVLRQLSEMPGTGLYAGGYQGLFDPSESWKHC